MTSRSQGASGARCEFLGLALDCLTMDETLVAVERLIDGGQPNQHVVINVGKVVLARNDPHLREIINACPLVNADGTGVVWGARALGLPVPERVAGIDLFQELVARSADRGWRVYFLGARPEVVEEVVRRFRRRFPDLAVAGFRDGYWDAADEPALVAEIASARPHLVFVAMPSPKKEYWLAVNLAQLRVPFAMGVGGAFDVVAGLTRRAPRWMQRAGLEWFFRLLQEPRRMWRRYVVGNPTFVAIVAREWWRQRRRCTGRRPES